MSLKLVLSLPTHKPPAPLPDRYRQDDWPHAIARDHRGHFWLVFDGYVVPCRDVIPDVTDARA